MENKTVDELLAMMQEWTHQDQAPAPSKWTEIALFLNLAKEKEYQKLFDLQQSVSWHKADLVSKNHTSISAKMSVESLEIFKQMKLQEAKLKMVDEQIKIAKAHGRLRSEELRGY